jgi:hypothetical protein
MRVVVLTIAALLSFAQVAWAGHITRPMFDALDGYGESYAKFQGWTYADRLANSHGDYRRAYATLVFTTTYEGTYDGKKVKVPGEWQVEARVVRCGPGWYVVGTPEDRQTCPVRFRLSW